MGFARRDRLPVRCRAPPFQAISDCWAVEFPCQIDKGLCPAMAAEGASYRVVGNGEGQNDRVRVRVREVEGPAHHMTKLVVWSVSKRDGPASFPDTGIGGRIGADDSGLLSPMLAGSVAYIGCSSVAAGRADFDSTQHGT